MKKARVFLKHFIFVELGMWVGKFLASYTHYKRYPGFYETMSAPWYTEILFSAALTGIIVALTFAAYLILGRIIRKKESQEPKEEKP
jgi:hypothetical protein